MIVSLKEIVVTGIFKDNHNEIEYDGEYEKVDYEIDNNTLLECYREYKQDNDLDIDDYLDDDTNEFIELYNDYFLGKGVRVTNE